MQYLWFETALLPSGWAEGVRVGINEGRIVSVGCLAPEPGDERHAIAVPGLSNVHSHAFQRGMAGLSEFGADGDDDFWSWREIMYRFLDHLGPDDIEAIAAMAYAEMLEGGYTRVGEFHYLHNAPDGSRYANIAETAERIVAAAGATGIGLTLLPVFYAHSDFGGASPKPGQRRFLSDVDGFAKLYAASHSAIAGCNDANIGIAPHSLRAVTAGELAALLPLCPEGPIHIHAAEQVKEVEASVAWSGARPVEWLLAHTALNARWCLIHATHLTDGECDALAASGAVAGLCPVTEANLGDGIFPARRFLAAGGRIATGTDSNILIDPAHELRALEYSQRLLHRSRNVLAGDDFASVGRRLFERTLAGGAQALGTAAGIAVGAPADIVSLDANHPALVGRSGDMLLDGWIFAARTSAVDCVWRFGRRVVSNGRHRDAEAILGRYRRTVEKLLAA